MIYNTHWTQFYPLKLDYKWIIYAIVSYFPKSHLDIVYLRSTQYHLMSGLLLLKVNWQKQSFLLNIQKALTGLCLI